MYWLIMFKSVRFWTVVFFGICSISLAHRDILIDGFDFLPGDRYDMVIMSSILEHWRNFWGGYSVWHDVGYFYPYKRTIAQTDGYFLIGIIYSLIRCFSDDIFLSVALTSIVLSFIGFSSLFWLANRGLKFNAGASILISSTFVVLHSIVSHHQRLQLMSVFILPLLSGILICYLRFILECENKCRISKSGCVFSILYGSLTITCFYVAWFYMLFLLMMLAVICIYQRTLLVNILKRLAYQKKSSTVVLFLFFLSLTPFVWAYFPKSQEVGVRLYSSVSGNLIAPIEIIQVGFDNYLYGPMLRLLFDLVAPKYVPSGEYYNVGLSPFVFLLFILAFFYFRSRRKKPEINVFYSLAITSIFCCMLLVKINGHSLWFFVYYLIPGAKALNAVSTFLMVIALAVLLVIGKYLDSINIPKYLFICIGMLMLIGEVSPSYNDFDRAEENKRIENIPFTPKMCRVFYVTGYKEQRSIPKYPEWVNSMYAHNVTAMLLSQIIKLPTINGVASFNPPDWNFAAPWSTDYERRIDQYVNNHNVTGICKFDLNTKKWSFPY